MGRQTLVIGVILVFVLTGAALGATGWKETAAGTQFRIDPRTNETQVGFYVALKYDPVPQCISLDVHWTVYRGDELLAEDRHRGTKHCRGNIQSVSFLSPFITPAPGETYRAKLVLSDTANGISHVRTITYTAPRTFPTGIGVNVKTPNGETHEIDLSGVSDENVDILAAYSVTLTEDYIQTASDTALSDFAARYASDDESYPVWIWVLATLGPEITGQGSGVSIHASYNRLLFFYRASSSEALKGVLDQLGDFGRDFTGYVLTRKSGEGPVYVFIDVGVWEMLSSAAEEAKGREPK